MVFSHLPVAILTNPVSAFGYSFIGFVGGFILGAVFGKWSSRAKT